MEYRNHGGLEISEIGIGCYALCGVYGKKDRAEFTHMIHRAYDSGVNFFDTADAYGDGETVLGKAVAEFRNEIILSTKVGISTGNKPDLKPRRVKSACEASLQKLGTDYIDIYNIHFNDPDTPVEETVSALDELVSEGKIRKYGLGHLQMPELKAYAGSGNIFSMLMELSAVSTLSSRTLLPFCRARNIGAIAFSVTGRGLLTGRFDRNSTFPKNDIRYIDPLFKRERFESALKTYAKFNKTAALLGRTPVQCAIAWVLSVPGIITALTGSSTVTHLEENIKGSGWKYSTDMLDDINSFIQREEQQLEILQKESMKAILAGPEPVKLEETLLDLIYVLETAAIKGYTPESDIIPIFYKVLAIKKNPEKYNMDDVLTIRIEAADLLFDAICTEN